MKSLVLHEHEIKQLSETGEVTVVRPVKPQPPEWAKFPLLDTENNVVFFPASPDVLDYSDQRSWPEKYMSCPFGQPGEIRWVRETWWMDEDDQPIVFYAATDKRSDLPLKSSSTMPQWASRFNVECGSVEVVKQLCADIWDWKIEYKKVG
ncbi:MAG: hypothetical protein WC554_17450 [Clostridia bacterium]|jgi:hypothetical protein